MAVIQFFQLSLLYFYNNVLIDTHYHVRNRALNNKLNTLVNECYPIFKTNVKSQAGWLENMCLWPILKD
jgi:hypothetical protein